MTFGRIRDPLAGPHAFLPSFEGAVRQGILLELPGNYNYNSSLSICLCLSLSQFFGSFSKRCRILGDSRAALQLLISSINGLVFSAWRLPSIRLNESSHIISTTTPPPKVELSGFLQDSSGSLRPVQPSPRSWEGPRPHSARFY